MKPLLVGIIIAFVLHRPYEHLRAWYGRKWRKAPKRAKVCAIVSVYLLALGALGALVCIVTPELVRNLVMFAANATAFWPNCSRWLTGLRNPSGSAAST